MQVRIQYHPDGYCITLPDKVCAFFKTLSWHGHLPYGIWFFADGALFIEKERGKLIGITENNRLWLAGGETFNRNIPLGKMLGRIGVFLIIDSLDKEQLRGLARCSFDGLAFDPSLEEIL